MKKTIISLLVILVMLFTSCSNIETNTGNSNETPDDSTDETPGDSTEETPDDNTDETPDDSTDETPDDSTDETPDDSTDETPGDSTDDTPDDSTEESNPDFENPTVFKSGDIVYLQATAADQSALKEYLCALENIGIEIAESDETFRKLEIIVGRSKTSIESSEAYKLLESIERKSYFTPRYLLYSKDGKLVLAYDENEYTPLSALEFIVDKLIESTVNTNGYVAIPNGVILYGSVDLIAEQKKLDDEMLEAAWESVKAGTSKEIYLALRRLYTLYDDSLIDWYANLYDPQTGLYYQTASGKATDGYLPDVESTKQALNFLETSGMLSGLGKFQQNVPELMGYKIVYYIKSIQSPNGYFYNPATTKNTLDTTGVGRRGRELSWCTQLLAAFGARPTYDTPNGKKGDGITADEYWESLDLGIAPPVNLVSLKNHKAALTSSLSVNSAVAVSKVVRAAQTSNPLTDYRAFIDYLHTLNIENNPYSGCGTINSIYGEIAYQSQVLKNEQGSFAASSSDPEKYKQFDGMDLKEITIAYINSLINPSTGLCGNPSSTRPNGTEFLYTNGFFKIIPVYNSWKIAYPEPILAAKALLAGTVSDEVTRGNICDVYNLWSALSGLRSNVRNYCDAASRDKVLAMFDEAMNENGAEAILCSYEKMANYKQPDGGFASSANGGLKVIHGCIPVGTGVKESNVDAMGKPTGGMLDPMFVLLGVDKVPIYTRHHWMQYLEIMLAAEEKEKQYFLESEEILSYNGMPLSSILWSTGASSNRYIEKESDGNSVYKVEKFDSSEQTVLYYALTEHCDAPDYVSFETEIKISDITSLERLCFSMGAKNAGHNNRPLRLSLSFASKENGALISLREEKWTAGSSFSTVATIPITPKVGDWFKLRFEYRLIDGTPETKVYIDGECVYTTNAVYSAAVSPTLDNMTVSIIFMKQLQATLKLDNTAFHQHPEE